MKGIPLSFVIVVVATIILTIFFGAWAVSADADARERSLAFVIGGAGPALDAPDSSSGSEAKLRGADEPGDGGSNADSWWGKSFLKACPLH